MRCMNVVVLVNVALAVFAPSAGRAQAVRDSGTYIVRLGVDTVSVERWVRTADGIEAVSVSRSPRTVVRRYALRFDGSGAVTHVVAADGSEREVSPRGAIPLAGGFQTPYVLAVQSAVRRGGAETRVPMLVGTNVREFAVQRVGDGEYAMPNQFDVPMRFTVDRTGGVSAIDAGGGSTVERVAWLDLDAMAREFAARDERGAGLGSLSPRDTTRATVGGATILVDYSRPSARGRTVMGGLVPYDEVWRTGANDATQLIVDRAVRVGDVRLDAGRYSLFTVPGRTGWQLIVNGQTGMSGLSRDPARDVGTTAMQVRALASHVEQFTILVEPAGDGAVLRLRWGTTEASVPVRPDTPTDG